jgi:IS605 OrfB family transposase
VKDSNPNAASFTRTLRLKVRAETYAWLNAAAIEVNAVFNYANEISLKAATRTDTKRKWMSGFDLCYLTAGATEFFDRIGADTIQSICTHYADKRRAAKRVKLRWRVSRGARRSLGWIPFKAASLKRKGSGLRFCGKTFRVFNRDYLGDAKWRDGCFAQDACGDWWVCLPVKESVVESVAPFEAVGIDLGLRTIATTSDGETLEAGRWTSTHADALANAQRRGHKRQAKRIQRKAKRQRADALHKFSRKIVDQYQNIIVGDVSSLKLVKTKMAKSVLDSGWGMLKQMLQYKGEYAGRSVQIVNERNTTRTCSSCRALTGPTGLDMLAVRQWECVNCGVVHDRDVNAARNILIVGSRCGPPCAGTSLSPKVRQPSQASSRCEARTGALEVAA